VKFEDAGRLVSIPPFFPIFSKDLNISAYKVIKGDTMSTDNNKTVISVFREDVRFLEQKKVHPRQTLAEVFHKYVTSFMPGTTIPSTTAAGFTGYSLVA
jgi:hypothetical protein